VITEEGSGSFIEAGGTTMNWLEGVNGPWVDSTLAEVFPNDPGATVDGESNSPEASPTSHRGTRIESKA
jgi:hypothetical protein